MTGFVLFITAEDLKCILGLKKYGACIRVTKAVDTLKRVDETNIIVTTLPRKNIWLAQTPQAFKYDLILEAHENAWRCGHVATDDALLVERLGEKVKIIMGSRFNIKITNKEDLDVARAILDRGLI